MPKDLELILQFKNNIQIKQLDNLVLIYFDVMLTNDMMKVFRDAGWRIVYPDIIYKNFDDPKSFINLIELNSDIRIDSTK